MSETNKCLICERIEMISKGTNPYLVKELETGYIVIGDHQHFRGYTLFLCKQHRNELYELDYDFRMKFLEEMALVGNAVAKAFRCEKMNYELLGNGDSHLHWHLFPRNSGDLEGYGINGKGPVWWYPFEEMVSHKNVPCSEELNRMKELLLAELNKITE